jgi:hypothetical protein
MKWKLGLGCSLERCALAGGGPGQNLDDENLARLVKELTTKT